MVSAFDYGESTRLSPISSVGTRIVISTSAAGWLRTGWRRCSLPYLALSHALPPDVISTGARWPPACWERQVRTLGSGLWRMGSRSTGRGTRKGSIRRRTALPRKRSAGSGEVVSSSLGSIAPADDQDRRSVYAVMESEPRLLNQHKLRIPIKAQLEFPA
jgi:hypothetical protein